MFWQTLLTTVSRVTLDYNWPVIYSYVSIEFFAGALMNDDTLQVPMHHAHVAAALTGEGEVHIVEIEGEGVVGVSVWFVHLHPEGHQIRTADYITSRFGPGQKFLST